MFGDREHDPVHADVQFFGGGGDDADIGLMRHQPVKRFLLHGVRRERLFNDAPERIYRHLEHLVALHADKRPAGLDLVVI